jgi:hypothetical protein
MQYKGAKKPLPEIARDLNVDAGIEGSVLRVGDRVRITGQLIGVGPERHLWARNYERDLRDVLSLQGEIARTIADEVKVNVTPDVQARLASARPVNPKAHEAYLVLLEQMDRSGHSESDRVYPTGGTDGPRLRPSLWIAGRILLDEQPERVRPSSRCRGSRKNEGGCNESHRD